jgi:DNA polymerase/3'-5' exonuclease PolX
VSRNPPRPLADAEAIAAERRELLAPGCERIEVAGSIRRRKPEVRDIELVAIPAMGEQDAGDLWGTRIPVDLLEERVTELRELHQVELRDVESHRVDGSVVHGHRNGPAYKALEYRGMPVDLFVVRPPAQWGVIFTIRTGPADWGQRIVTLCQRYLWRVQDGVLYQRGAPVACPEEADFLRAIGQPWVEPAERSAERVQLGPSPKTY